MKTLYAAFDDATKAESAANALLQAGAPAKDMSLVASEAARRLIERPTPVALVPQALPPSAVADLNPAQNDYPRTGSTSTTELSSRPPDASQDFNPGLDESKYAADYDVQADRELEMVSNKDITRREETNLAPESDAGPQEVAHHTIADSSTTAKRSAVFGLGVGTLAAVSAIAIPGFGLILGGGALAAAAAAIAANRGSEEVAGGVAGWLAENGVPGDAIPELRSAYEKNGAILTLQSELPGAEATLREHGATHVGRYGIE